MKRDNKKNELDEQLEDIKEYQDNIYNPGHYIGTGRVPLPLKNLVKYPVIMFIAGALFLIPALITLFKGFGIESIMGSGIPLIVGAAFVYGGLVRLKRK